MDLRKQKLAELKQLNAGKDEEAKDAAMVLLDIDGTILSWNPRVQKVKGYLPEEIIGQHFRLFYLPGDRQAQLPEKLILTATRDGKAEHIGRRLRKDGTVFIGKIVITAIRNTSNVVVGFTKVTQELQAHEVS